MTHPTRAAAAKAVRVGVKTLWRWQQLPAFRLALTQARAEAFDSGLSTLKAGLAEATERLRRALRSRNERTACSAARTLVEFALRAHETLEIEARLESLESQVTNDEDAQQENATA